MDGHVQNQNNKPKTDNGKWAVLPPEPKPYTPEWYIANYLENWDDSDIEVAIRNDVRPDLSTYAELILDQTTDFFMNFFKATRPDLKHLQTKEGREWVKRIVKSATGFR